jgi:ribosome-associated toxin RatA of RatAB toxin-antitoxin module
MTNLARGLRVLLGAALLLGCGEKKVDWAAPENLMVHEDSSSRDDAAVLEYWSLIDAPCKPIYDALADVEHYPEFIPGVDRSNLLSVTENTKTIQIAQRVISRQSNAKVEWKFDPAKQHIEFKTLHSDLAYNDGSYDLEASPDGKRCVVKSIYVVKAGEGQKVPVGVLASGTRDGFLAAARGVRNRATGKP